MKKYFKIILFMTSSSKRMTATEAFNTDSVSLLHRCETKASLLTRLSGVFQSPGPMEADLKKTMEECRRLTTEISTLKEENEILRVGIIDDGGYAHYC